jgi:hypothetical protein
MTASVFYAAVNPSMVMIERRSAIASSVRQGIVAPAGMRSVSCYETHIK